MKQELISWAHSSHMISIFEISDWINSSLFSISRSVSRLNRVHDLNCRSFFILFSSLPLIIGTFVTESTAVLCCTEPGTAFQYSNKGNHAIHSCPNVTPQIVFSSKRKVPNRNKTNSSIKPNKFHSKYVRFAAVERLVKNKKFALKFTSLAFLRDL